MSSATLQRPTPPRTGETGPVRAAQLGGTAGVSAALAGMLVTVGLALVLWAVTPAATDPGALVQAGLTAFAAGNGVEVAIGASVLSLAPLTLGVIGLFCLWRAVARPARPVTGTTGLAVQAATAGISYGATIAVVAGLLGTGLVAGTVWVPGAVGLLVCVLAAAGRSDQIADLLDRAPAHTRVALRLVRIGAVAVLGLGALTLVVGLLLSFGQAVTLGGAAVGGGLGDGLGLFFLGLAYLPTVIVGAVGFATGAGVRIGDATFSPFGSVAADLPAVPWLAALPDTASSALGLFALALPVAVGGVLGWSAARQLTDLRSRWIAVGSAAVVVGLGTGLVTLLAAGGISGGRWADTGVSFWPVTLLLAVELAVVGGLVAALVPRGEDRAVTLARRQARRADRRSRRTPAVEPGADDVASDAAEGDVDTAAADADDAHQDAADVEADEVADTAASDADDVNQGTVESDANTEAGDIEPADADPVGADAGGGGPDTGAADAEVVETEAADPDVAVTDGSVVDPDASRRH